MVHVKFISLRPIKKRTAFSGPNFMQYTSDEHDYMRSRYTEFWPNWTINMECTDKKSFNSSIMCG